jgi:site-specific DNA-methyltransferase (adenine-specific)
MNPIHPNSIIHGDCLEVMRDIEDKSIDMILCDLPYGITACKWDSVIPFELLWEQYKRIIKDRGAIVLTASQPFTSALVMSNPKMFKYQWVWKKRNAGNIQLAKYQPLKITEDICVFGDGRVNYYPLPEPLCESTKNRYKYKSGSKTANLKHMSSGLYKQQYNFGKEHGYPKNILEYGQDMKSFHPTQKPVSLFEYLIKTYTNEGDTVLDNCAGSGTTGVACINTNRKYILIEKEEKYFEICKQRVTDAVESITKV